MLEDRHNQWKHKQLSSFCDKIFVNRTFQRVIDIPDRTTVSYLCLNTWKTMFIQQIKERNTDDKAFNIAFKNIHGVLAINNSIFAHWILHQCSSFSKTLKLWNICVTNDHGYVPLVVNTSRSFPHSWVTNVFVTRLTRRVSLVAQELLTLPENLSPPPVLSEVLVTRSLVLCVFFVDRCLSFCPFSFGHYVVCPSSIYGFWLPLWYLQTPPLPFSTPWWQVQRFYILHMIYPSLHSTVLRRHRLLGPSHLTFQPHCVIWVQTTRDGIGNV